MLEVQHGVFPRDSFFSVAKLCQKGNTSLLTIRDQISWWNQWSPFLISISIKVSINHKLAREYKYIQFCIEIPELRVICYPRVAGETSRQDGIIGEELFRVLHKPASKSNKTKILICKQHWSHPHYKQINGCIGYRYIQRSSPTSMGIWNVAPALLEKLIH